MCLTLLRLANIRNIEQAEILPAAHLNFILGPNGSGKTSLLEAIYLLGRGRSFRAAQMQHVLRRGVDGFTIYGRLEGGGGVGVEFCGGEWRLRIDGQPARNRAALAAALAVSYVGPDTYRLFTGGPNERRQFLDWGVFHVEHDFLGVWQRYVRALRQRNAALRSAAYRGAESAWDGELAASAELIDRARFAYCQSLIPWAQCYSDALLGQGQVSVDYARGWSQGDTYINVLQRSLDQDRMMGHTRYGPHRADLGLRWAGALARDGLSRGQQKLLMYALCLGQLRYFTETTRRPAIVLLDDFTSELDIAHRGRVLALLAELPVQIFVTSTEPIAAPGEVTMFHVEHGMVVAAAG